MLWDDIAKVIKNVGVHTNVTHTHTEHIIKHTHKLPESWILFATSVGRRRKGISLIEKFLEESWRHFVPKSTQFTSLFFSNPSAYLVPCNCLHGCHSHMTGISHRSCLVTHYVFLIGRCYYKLCDWLVFLVGYHVVSGFAVLMFCRESWQRDLDLVNEIIQVRPNRCFRDR